MRIVQHALTFTSPRAATISPNTVIDTMRRDEAKGSHTTPKRFSLIDFEGPPVVNSTGMHRNATLLNSSAMERLRSLSASPFLLPSLLSSLPAVYTAATTALAPFPVPSPFPTSLGLSHFRSRPCRRGSIFAHRSITGEKEGIRGRKWGSRQYFPSAAYQAP